MILRGDCVEAMREMPEASVDAVVTDPPYGLEFMGKEWDRLGDVVDDPASVGGFQDGNGGNPYSRSRIRFGLGKAAQDWHHAWATECLRVLKPGGHLLAFGGTRTYHRLTCAIEDAGFEIRDCLAWMYGSGFPKSLNLNGDHQGWGTALKPAHEPIVLARKPLTGTVAQNVTRHGTGALNVDGCRVPGAPRTTHAAGNFTGTSSETAIFPMPNVQAEIPSARWPSNVLLDEPAAELLDEQSGERKAGGNLSGNEPTASGLSGVVYGEGLWREKWNGYGDSGGASRFFYTAKASRAERNAGLEGQGQRVQRYGEQGQGPTPQQTPRVPLIERNHHPTVKPIDLMRWLCRLVTPPGGHVLDPFAGSGTTGVACGLEGFAFTGIERETEYADIAEARIAYWTEHGEKALLAMYEAERRRTVEEAGQMAMSL